MNNEVLALTMIEECFNDYETDSDIDTDVLIYNVSEILERWRHKELIPKESRCEFNT